MDHNNLIKSVEETTQHHSSVLAPPGSTALVPDIHLHGMTTLNCTRGQMFRKVMPDDQQTSGYFNPFYCGLPVEVEDKALALAMMDQAMPLIQDGTGNFGFVFDETLGVKSLRFDENRHFEMKDVRGKGAAGDVTAFINKHTQMPFVRKRLKQKKILRKEEIQSLIRLSHPNVVKVLAVFCDHGSIDIILQDAGYSLRDCLKRVCERKIEGKNYWQMVKDLARQGFLALAHIHQQNIVHLDIKPENLLVQYYASGQLVLRLADFGSSVCLPDLMSLHLELTQEYWCPEMWHHVIRYLQQQHAGQRAYKFPPEPTFDTYAMGLVVYFMCTLLHLMKVLDGTNKKPVTDPNSCFPFRLKLMTEQSHIMQDRADCGPWLFNDIPYALREVMHATLHSDPNLRYTDQQAADHLSESEQDLKAPTPVQDTSSSQDEPSAANKTSPVPQTHFDSSTPGVNVGQAEHPRLMSLGKQRFQQQIEPHMKHWDITTQGQQPTVPKPSSVVQDDIAVNANLQSASAVIIKRPVVNVGMGGVQVRSRMPGCSTVEASTESSLKKMEVDLDMKRKEVVLLVVDDLVPQVEAGFDDGFAKGKKEMGGGVGEVQLTGKNGQHLLPDPVHIVAHSQQVFHLQQPEPVNQQQFKLPDSPTKGRRLAAKGNVRVSGKGVGKRMPMKSEGKREPTSKLSSTVTKSKMSGKFGPGKNASLVATQMTEPTADCPYFVASSSRPKPRKRKMSELVSLTWPQSVPGAQPHSCAPVREDGDGCALSHSPQGMLQAQPKKNPSHPGQNSIAGYSLSDHALLISNAGQGCQPLVTLRKGADGNINCRGVDSSLNDQCFDGSLNGHLPMEGLSIGSPPDGSNCALVNSNTQAALGVPGASLVLPQAGYKVDGLDPVPHQVLQLLEHSGILDQLETPVQAMDMTPQDTEAPSMGQQPELESDIQGLADMMDDNNFSCQGNIPDFTQLFDM